MELQQCNRDSQPNLDRRYLYIVYIACCIRFYCKKGGFCTRPFYSFMPQARFHIIWLFIFNTSLIILTPLIRGSGNYLAFTLIFLSTNILILSFVWQAIKNGAIEIVLSPLSVVSLFFLCIILSSFFFTINPASTRYGFFTMASVIINSIFLSFVRPTGLHQPPPHPLPPGGGKNFFFPP